jgi:hypothetical protein
LGRLTVVVKKEPPHGRTIRYSITPVKILASLILPPAILWAAAALYIDVPISSLRIPLSATFLILIVVSFVAIRRRSIAVTFSFALFAAVVAWWFTLTPSNSRAWQHDVAQTPWAEIQGDRVVIHNVRNCDYTTETDYRTRWETRTFDLSQIRGIDLFMDYWGSPYIAHTILSFDFANSPPIAISIETRKEIGENYSTILGFFRQYELIYVIGDERDLIRVRTNYRKGEDVYLYHTRRLAGQARAIFLDYLKTANQLHVTPRWYNALTANCTTSIAPHVAVASSNGRVPWDWRILINGYADKMAYDHGNLAGGLPFDELKRRAHINDAARAADQAPDFFARIRAGRPGFN